MDKTSDERTGSSIGSSMPWLAIGLLVLGLLVWRSSQRQQISSVEAGAALPTLAVSGWLNSPQPVTNEQLHGQVVLIDCWTTWCGPCRAAMPDLVKLKDRFRDQDVVVLGLTTESSDQVSTVEQYVDSVPGMDWPIAYGAGPTFEALDVHQMPTLLVFDRQGTLLWRGHGIPQAEDALVKALAGG